MPGQVQDGYAVVIGEALIDMIEGRCDGEPVYRPLAGGGPMNIAVGLARLGARSEFVGSFGDDALADRLLAFLADNGVGLDGVVRAAAPTTIAMTTFEGANPQFTFYGAPASYGLLSPDRLDRALVGGAAVLHSGSICLLERPVLETVRAAYALPGPLKTLDPNVRLSLLGDVDGFRDQLEELYGMVDLVKLSDEDAAVLYPGPVEAAARRIAAFGPRTVVVTLGAAGAMLLHDGDVVVRPGRRVAAVDATGGGDAAMAGLIYGLLRGGLPASLDAWVVVLDAALDVAAATVLAHGGATAMPTAEAVRARFGTVL